MIYGLVCLLSVFGADNRAQSQIKNTGIPMIRNYDRDLYHAGRQTWDMAQDGHQVLYFANNSGVLEFDGTNWRLFPVTNRSVVRSVAVDDTGRVYVGAANDFGYLRELPNGRKTYHSLLGQLPEKYHGFGEIWKIFITNNGVIYQSFNSVFFFKDNQIKVLAHGGNFHFAFYRQQDLYITSREKGLMRFNGQEFEEVWRGAFFDGDRRIWTMMNLQPGRFLIGTQNDGLYVYTPDTLRPWKSPANEFLKKNQLFSATQISRQYFAFGSIQNGLILTDRRGEILQHINKEKGLQNNTILSATSDHAQNLWLGLDNGIDYIEVNSPISYVGEGFKVAGTGYASAVHQGDLYLGTNQGLFCRADAYEDGKLRIDGPFQLVSQTKGQVWDLTRLDGQLFCGHNKGAFVIEDMQARQISNIQGGWDFLPVPGRPRYIIQGCYNGLVRLKKTGDRWRFDGMIQGFDESSMIETWDDQGNLWISHGYKGIYRLRLNAALDSVTEVALYNEKDGLPSTTGNSVFKSDQKIYAATDQGVYRYVFLADQFEKDTTLAPAISGEQVGSVQQDPFGNLWYFTNYSEQIGMIPSSQTPSAFKQIGVLHKLNNQYVPAFEHINVLDSSNIILGTVNGFAHFDPSLTFSTDHSFQTLIRACSFLGNKDSLHFYNLMDHSRDLREIDLNPLRSVKFQYTATAYDNLQHTRFSYFLKGYDKQWSTWTNRNTKEYTNLPPGEYVFRVRGKNIYGEISKTSSFHFEILPPWYQTTWAYIGYALVTIGFIFFTAQYLSHRLEKEKLKIEEKNREELRKQREEYERDQLAMKNKIMQLENEKLQTDIANEEANVQLKNKELSSQALHINRKNEILNYLKKELDKVTQRVNADARQKLKDLNKKIEQDLNLEKDWENFEQYFNQVQGDYIARLKEKYPDLSPKDLKLCAYLRMNLSSKEIASLLNITPRGVEIHRYRLRKKLNLKREDNLVEFLMEL